MVEVVPVEAVVTERSEDSSSEGSPLWLSAKSKIFHQPNPLFVGPSPTLSLFVRASSRTFPSQKSASKSPDAAYSASISSLNDWILLSAIVGSRHNKNHHPSLLARILLILSIFETTVDAIFVRYRYHRIYLIQDHHPFVVVWIFLMISGTSILVFAHLWDSRMSTSRHRYVIPVTVASLATALSPTSCCSASCFKTRRPTRHGIFSSAGRRQSSVREMRQQPLPWGLEGMQNLFNILYAFLNFRNVCADSDCTKVSSHSKRD
jgi:hypothetical protein